jgi:hypothetical protein
MASRVAVSEQSTFGSDFRRIWSTNKEISLKVWPLA